MSTTTVQLGGCTIYRDTARWSEDERIAVVTSDVVYVLVSKLIEFLARNDNL